jgi:hypothetical protein
MTRQAATSSRPVLSFFASIFFVAMIATPSAGAQTPFQPVRVHGAYNEALRHAGIEPHSANPTGSKPYAVCPAPSAGLFACLSAVVPEELAARDKSSLAGPKLQGSGEFGGYSPADLRSAYNLPVAGGAGLTIAITIAYDYPKAESDLATYRATYGLPPCTSKDGCFVKVNQEGKVGGYPEARSGWAAEAALDLDMASAVCPDCELLLVEADDNQIESLPLAVSTAAELGADVISNSWGGGEFPQETSLDSNFHHPGIPVLFASGDSGYEVSYPAAAPDVVAVGGTSLRKDESARGWRESAWSGAGSGCSEYEEKPSWQSDLGCGTRTVADVAAVADPQTPVSVYDTYGGYEGWLLFGGTSVATPLLAGVEALSSTPERAKGAELFWDEGPEGKLFDVGEGRNGGCPPAPEYLCLAKLGYDGPTGWGTPGASRPGAPVLATYDASDVGAHEATLNGAINPNGDETTYQFEYDTTPYEGKTPHGTSIPASAVGAGSGAQAVEVAHDLTGLAPDTTYHYRLVATNAFGTTYGGDHAFLTSEWSVQYMPRKPQREEMFGVSCASADECVSVGAQLVNFEGFFANEEPLVERWDGAEWMREPVPVYHQPASGYASRLEDVSCSAPDACMAVGENYEIGVGYGPLVERWDGEQWSIVPAPLPSEAALNQNGTYEVRLHGVSCTSPTSCVLVGEFTKAWSSLSPGEIGTLVERWNGSSWTVQQSPNPPGALRNLLWGVSCPAAASCVAVGESRISGGARKTLIERWDGTEWSVEPGPSLSGGLQDVSCSAESACMAVGGTEGVFGGQGRAEAWDGTSWTSSALGQPMRGVSCLAPAWCIAVGGDMSSHEAYAEMWDGTEWTVESPVRPTDASDEPMELYDVSCVSSACEATGWYWSWGFRPLAEHRGIPSVLSAPSAENDPVSAVSQSSALLHAHVDNNGAASASSCHFEVALKADAGSPLAEPPCEPDPVAGDASTPVQAFVAGLDPNTEYVYRVVAENEVGTDIGAPDEEFSTLPEPPTVENGGADAVTQTTAVLKGSVDNHGDSAGSGCKFVIALESVPNAPVAEPPCDPSPVFGSGPAAVEATVHSLSANTRYVFRIIATNAGGDATGSPDGKLKTEPNAPTVVNDPVGAVAQTSAVLNAHVDNEGAESRTTCKFVITQQSAPEEPLAEPPCEPDPVGGDGSTPVQALATALDPNTEYVYRVVAENEAGTEIGTPDEEFSTLPEPPTVENGGADAVTQTTAVLKGHVDNHGAWGGSGCLFEWGRDESYGSATACQPSPVFGNGLVAVSVPQLSGLEPNATYHFRIVASSAGGTSRSADQTFTMLVATCETNQALCPPPFPAVDGRTAMRSCIAHAREVFRSASKAAESKHGLARTRAMRRARKQEHRSIHRCEARFRTTAR